MSGILQIALLLTSLALIALAACAIPLLLQARRQLVAFSHVAERWQVDLDALLRESREMVRNTNALVLRADLEMDDLVRVVHIVRQWAERGDQFMGAVRSMMETPVVSALRNASGFGAGVGIFVKYLFGARKHSLKEANHG